MKSSWAAAAIVVALLVVLGAGFWLWRSRASEPNHEAIAGPAGELPASEASASAAATRAPSANAEEAWPARLYLPATNDLLVAQDATVFSAPTARARAIGVVQALLAATPVEPRVAVFPPEVKLAKLLLLDDGTVIINLKSEPVGEPPASGSTLEELRIYAVVNTILRNVEEAKRVVLLWNGVQRPTLSGHVDTGRPLRLRTDLEAP